jgi:hypothetical protein
MSTIRLHRTTTSTPEQYLTGLIDFGPGRSKLFRNSADEYLQVHQRGRVQADVTEGSQGVTSVPAGSVDRGAVRANARAAAHGVGQLPL